MSSGDVVALVGHLAWPLTVLVILVLLRHQVRAVVERLAARIADPRTDVGIGREGLQLTTRVETLEGAIETQQLKAGVLAQTVASEVSAAGTSGNLPHVLHALAEKYREIDEPVLRERTRKKNQLADAMGATVLRENVNRDALVAEQDEVMTLALATAVLALARDGDDFLLLRAGNGVRRLHVRYRVAAAIAQLAQYDLLSPELISDTETMLSTYRRGADAALTRRLDWTMATLAGYRKRVEVRHHDGARSVDASLHIDSAHIA